MNKVVKNERVYDVINADGVKLYSFYFHRERFKGKSISYCHRINNDGSYTKMYYSYFADVRNAAINNTI